MSHVMYLGTAPKNGLCAVTPTVGYAEITEFRMAQAGWTDVNPITAYNFYYSFDGGNIFIPIQADNSSLYY